MHVLADIRSTWGRRTKGVTQRKGYTPFRSPENKKRRGNTHSVVIALTKLHHTLLIESERERMHGLPGFMLYKRCFYVVRLGKGNGRKVSIIGGIVSK